MKQKKGKKNTDQKSKKTLLQYWYALQCKEGGY